MTYSTFRTKIFGHVCLIHEYKPKIKCFNLAFVEQISNAREDLLLFLTSAQK